MRSLGLFILRMVSLLHISSCRMEDECHVMLRLYFQDVWVFFVWMNSLGLVVQYHSCKGSLWVKVCFLTTEYDFSQSANSSGVRDYLLCLWAVTGSSRIKDLLMSKSFCCKTLRRPCLFSSQQNKFYDKAEIQQAFQKYTVFREIHRFGFFLAMLIC